MPHVEIAKELCKGCGLCVSVCPKKVLELGEGINTKGYYFAAQAKEGCIGCKMCAEICPDVAITVFKEVKAEGGKS